MSEGYNNKKLEQSEGVDHARRAIASARDRYLDALLGFNTAGKNGNRILIPYKPNQVQRHVVVYETLTAWRLLVADEYLDERSNGHWGAVLGEIPLPTALWDGEDVAQIDLYEKERSDFGVPQDPREYSVDISDLKTKDIKIGLGNLTWFDDKFLTVEILGRQGFDGRETATKQFRVVPPMYLLKKAGRKLNSLYAQIGEGIQPKQPQPHGKT